MSEKPSKTITDDMETTKERHRKYLRAINNPIRRKIIRAILDGNKEYKNLRDATGIDSKTLDWHIRILEDGYCIERKNYGDFVSFEVTREGKVIDFMDKE